MKKLAIIGLAAVAVMLTPLMVSGQEEAKDVTLTGEPVDIQCFLQGRSGEGHASCAKSCAEKGLPIGLYVGEGDEGELYLVLGGGGKDAKAHLAEHMGKQVKATGKVSMKGGMKVLTVAKVEA
jgi:hypothetical protein